MFVTTKWMSLLDWYALWTSPKDTQIMKPVRSQCGCTNHEFSFVNSFHKRLLLLNSRPCVCMWGKYTVHTYSHIIIPTNCRASIHHRRLLSWSIFVLYMLKIFEFWSFTNKTEKVCREGYTYKPPIARGWWKAAYKKTQVDLHKVMANTY